MNWMLMQRDDINDYLLYVLLLDCLFCPGVASSFSCFIFLQPATPGVVPTISHSSQSGVIKYDLATPNWPTACTRLVAPS
jgi:hypothetical protein